MAGRHLEKLGRGSDPKPEQIPSTIGEPQALPGLRRLVFIKGDEAFAPTGIPGYVRRIKPGSAEAISPPPASDTPALKKPTKK